MRENSQVAYPRVTAPGGETWYARKILETLGSLLQSVSSSGQCLLAITWPKAKQAASGPFFSTRITSSDPAGECFGRKLESQSVDVFREMFVTHNSTLS